MRDFGLTFFVFFSVFFGCLSKEGFARANTIEKLMLKISQTKDSADLAGLYSKVAFLYSYRNLDSMETYVQRSYALAKRFDHKEAEILSLIGSGILFFEKGNPYLGYKYVNEGLLLSKKFPNRDLRIELELVNAMMLIKEGKIDQGSKLLEDTFAKIDLVKSDSVRAQITISYHLAKAAKMDSTAYTELQTRLRNISSSNHLPYGDAILDHAFINLDFQKSRISNQEFLEGIEKLLISSKLLEINQIALFCYMDLARYWVEKNSDIALKYLLEGVDLAHDTGYESLEYGMLKFATSILDKDPTQVSLSNQLKTKMLDMSSARIEENKKSGVDFLKFVQKDNEIQVQTQKSNDRKIWLFVLGIAVLSVSVLAYVLFRQYRTNRALALKFKVMNQELEKKNLRLEENDDFHKKLISMLSHDLRQPFSLILMMSDSLIEEVDRQQIQLVMQEIKRSAAVSLQTMDGLLNWMRMQIMRIKPSVESVSLKNSIYQALEFSEFIKERKSIRIVSEISTDMGVLVPNEVLLFINRNILLNALNYSPVNATITIKASIQDVDKILVEIADEGKGLDPQILNNLFKKDGISSEKKHGGAGVSMIISAEMIQNLGGKIWAENNIHGGASFFYLLPFKPFTSTVDLVNIN